MIEIDGAPELTDPVMIVAFEGWNDAADAATDSVEYLETVWDAKQVGSIEPDDYYDFQVNRPVASIGEDGIRKIDWPTTRISVVKRPIAPRDLVIVRGIEPNMRWRTFAAELLAVADEFDVEMIVILGALLADVPHTRPVPVTGTTTDPGLAKRLGLDPSRYEGPTGIVGVLQDAAGTYGLPAVSIWAAVPHYVAQPPCPKAVVALLRRIEDLLDIPIPLGELPEDARAWERGANELAAEDEEVAEYVSRLEAARDATDLPEASGDHIAREFERYLRRRGEGQDF